MKIVENKQDIPNEYLGIVFSKWETFKGASAMPAKAVLEGGAFDSIYAYCKFADVEADQRVRYTKIGDALKKFYGQDIENKYLEDLFDPWVRRSVLETYKTCINEKRPVYERKGFATVIGSLGYEYLLLPFYADNDQSVDMILSCLLPLNSKTKVRL